MQTLCTRYWVSYLWHRSCSLSASVGIDAHVLLSAYGCARHSSGAAPQPKVHQTSEAQDGPPPLPKEKLASVVTDPRKKEASPDLPTLSIKNDDVVSKTHLSNRDQTEWTEQKVSLRELPQIYLKLSKYRLTGLVVLTAMAGYAVAPGALDASTLLCSCAGIAMCSGAANSINQWIEIPFDSQMARTRNRVLVRGLITPLHALAFALVSGAAGAALLLIGVNSLTAALGVTNVFLYTMAYTPLKRVSIVNTWVGSVVGAIPPVMGWAACTGSLSSGALVLGGLLYAWQFPHFNALSWSHRADYSRGGYRMMSVTEPELCRRVALRYSLATVPLCLLAPVCGLTTWWFALDSLPINLWLSYLAWNFYRDADFKSSRRLFRFSLLYLPLIFAVMLINKCLWREQKGSKTEADPLENSTVLVNAT